jgi:hypothetical protein
VIAPRGETVIEPGDHVVVSPTATRSTPPIRYEIGAYTRARYTDRLVPIDHTGCTDSTGRSRRPGQCGRFGPMSGGERGGFGLAFDPDLRVEWRASASLLGTILKYLAVTLLPPLAIAIVDGEVVLAFVLTAALAVLVGAGLERIDPDPDLGPREALLVVAATWLAVALFGVLPYVLAGTGTIAHRSTPSSSR